MTDPEHAASARIAYDHGATGFVEAVGTEVSPQFEAALDRSVLQRFSDVLAAGDPGTVLDVGCGPGRIAAFLASRGHDVVGIDIADQMVAAARTAHPDLRFEVGPLTDLPVATGTAAGVAFWYSIIATPLSELHAVWAELDRVLRPGGEVLIAFQAGDNHPDERPQAYGSETTLTLYHHDVDDVVASLAAAGFEAYGDVRRPAELPHERTPQAFLSARRC